MRVTQATSQYYPTTMSTVAIPNNDTSYTDMSVTYTNTGFGQLPVRCESTSKDNTRGQPTLIKVLLITALILSLSGLLYLLIYVTITYHN